MSAYICFYVVLTTIFSFINIPAVTILTNVIGIWGLSFLYNRNPLLNLRNGIIVYSIMVLEEMFFYYLINDNAVSIFIQNEHADILIVFLYDITLLLSAVCLKYFFRIRGKRKNISTKPAVNMIISFITIVIILILATETNVPGNIITWIAVLLLFVNLISIWGYELAVSSFNEHLEKEKLIEQTKSYEKELSLMDEAVKTARKYKHDEKNHILALQGLIKEKAYEKATKYLEDMLYIHIAEDNVIRSRSEIINSILNYKIKKMTDNKVQVKTYINVADNIPMSDYDMSLVLGNIMDNSIEALMKIPEEKRFIDIEIIDEKNKFTIKVKNTYDGNIENQNGILMTTKNDRENHGIGIRNIEKAVEKYGGLFKTTYDEKEFTSYVLILHN